MLTKHPYRAVTLFVFFLLFAFSMGNQIIYHYAVPPGGDAINHIPYVTKILEGKISDVYHYHILWHTITALVSTLTSAPPITVMAWMGPFLLVTAGISIFWFTLKYFGPVSALAATICFGFFSNQPLQTLYDGGFPNVLAAGTVLPLTLLAAENCIDNQRTRKAIGLFLLSIFILSYSHHIVTLYALAVLGIFFPIQFALSLRRKHINLFLIGLGFLIGFLVLLIMAYAAMNYFDGSAASLARQFSTIDTKFPFFHLIGKLDNPNAMWPLAVYPDAIGQLPVYVGALGFMLAMAFTVWHRHEGKGRISLILVAWTVILVVGSQTPAMTFPVRLARDLGVPLSILVGIFVGSTYSFFSKKRIPTIFIYVLVVLSAWAGLATGISRYEGMIRPNSRVDHLQVDTEATEYITKNIPIGSTILTFNDNTHQRLFAPLHTFLHISDPKILRLLADETTINQGIAKADYVYVEYRSNKEETWVNNSGMIDKYQRSPYFETNSVSFIQPEKSIQLLKVNRRLVPRPIPES